MRVQPRWSAAAIGVFVMVGLGVWQVARVVATAQPAEPLSVEVEGAQMADPSMVVHVTGAVVRPGLVEIPAGSRVADAVLAAGGVNPEAVVDGLNLALRVADGGRVHVPSASATGQEETASEADSAGSASGLVSLTTATQAELETLPGVGPVTAQRILAHRGTSGGFTTVEDLLEVPGIGEARLAAIRDLVVP